MKKTPKHMDVAGTRDLRFKRASLRNDTIKTIAAVVTALATLMPLVLQVLQALFD